MVTTSQVRCGKYTTLARRGHLRAALNDGLVWPAGHAARASRFTGYDNILATNMPNAFDPYREALVVETSTIWPDEYDTWEPAERTLVAQRLHAEPQAASEMDYVRLHTGFCRQITVTPADVARVK